jgi:hypothetical protein
MRAGAHGRSLSGKLLEEARGDSPRSRPTVAAGEALDHAATRPPRDSFRHLVD